MRDLHLLIHTVALAAAGVVLGVALWQGSGIAVTAKKMAAAYLGFFCLGVVAALASRALSRRPQTAAAAAADPAVEGDGAPEPDSAD